METSLTSTVSQIQKAKRDPCCSSKSYQNAGHGGLEGRTHKLYHNPGKPIADTDIKSSWPSISTHQFSIDCDVFGDCTSIDQFGSVCRVDGADEPSESSQSSVFVAIGEQTDRVITETCSPLDSAGPSPSSDSPRSPSDSEQSSAEFEWCQPLRNRTGLGLGRIPSRRRRPQLTSSPSTSSEGSPTRRRSSCSTPDRFIPGRRLTDTSADKLRVNKIVETLTTEEKEVRRQSAGPDPFDGQTRYTSRPIPQNQLPPPPRGLSTMQRSSTLSLLGPGRASNGANARQVSSGAVWNVGGSSIVTNSVSGVSDGHGRILARGTNAPLYGSIFHARTDPAVHREIHERRLALAMDVDQASRILGPVTEQETCPAIGAPQRASSHESYGNKRPAGTLIWRDNEWAKDGSTKVLDAPFLRDDYYCSLLAYSPATKFLAVGLGSQVFLWSETKGVVIPEKLNHHQTAHVTCVAFSSVEGGKSILIVGRVDGRFSLWSPCETDPRFILGHYAPVSCCAFNNITRKCPSMRDRSLTAITEDLLLGDETGCVFLFSVEWPSEDDCELFDWKGSITPIAKISLHTQQICGLAWSTEGDLFATGGNDNVCHLFEARPLVDPGSREVASRASDRERSEETDRSPNAPEPTMIIAVGPGGEKHRWTVNAAVKAIAFCPWQRGLVAIGGGSNDRCIHFYHTLSGACLAKIDCAAQVTSLIWSTTRREIAATFGFAQPEHPYRIAVYSWPRCEQIVAIPWFEEHRALYAIPYPGGPNNGQTKGEGGAWWSRTGEEGCIVVASSDSSIKFHEVWSEGRRATLPHEGSLGGSNILEGLHGIEKEGRDVIR